ncbi:MAG: TrkA C-terminal domain-containing protein, partial [Pseudomonadota bacterium]
INPRSTTVSSILRHVRRGRIKAVYSLGSGEAEVIEAQVMQTSPIAGKRLRDVNFPKGALVGVLRHKGNLIMPRGDTVVEVGAQLVVFSERSAVSGVERLFRVSMEYF